MRSSASRPARADIQALRAVAVAFVVVYHLLPDALPGGFVGVDVFFVISGFLITTILIERPPRGVSDLVAFWGRRVRRLLPASLLVLLVSTVLSWIFLPVTQWMSTARYVRAAALYVVNWLLASDAVDYLGAEKAPSIVQHYWSLAVEEQFYVVWPLLALLALGGRTRKLQLAAMTAVVIVSFGWSVEQTMTDPQVAYFSTFTRMWELGAGGLLAGVGGVVVPNARTTISRLLAVVGWSAILASGFVLSAAASFPGWVASLPVVGAVLVIAAAVDFRWYEWRGVRWLGDVSYSVYLWHWPLAVIVPVASGAAMANRLEWRDALIVLALTLLFAGLTKTYVEDRFRTPEWSGRIRATYLSGVAGMAVVLVAAGTLSAAVSHRLESDDRRVEASKNPDRCFGAGALGTGRHCPTSDAPLVPSPLQAEADLSPAYDKRQDGQDCFSGQPAFPVIACHYGDRRSSFRVILMGNSHAGHWVPAIDRIAKQRHWRVTAYLTSSCASSFTVPAFDTESESRRCVGWVTDVLSKIRRDPPSLVVVANHVGRPAWGGNSVDGSKPEYVAGFRTMLDELIRIQRPIVVIRDTPVPTEAERGGLISVPDCLAKRPRQACSGPRSQWIRSDPAAQAAHALRDKRVSVVDLNDHFCSSRTCFGAVGGVVVYADGHHLTATFSRTLAPFLEPHLLAAIKRSPVP